MFHKTILTTIMSLAILAAASALAGVTRVTVHVDGLACPFCAYNLEKRIKTLDGVSKDLNWEASIDNGTASFDWNPEVKFNAEAVREQVRKAGFTPRTIEVQETDTDRGVTGTLTLTRARDGKEVLRLALKDHDDVLTLVPADRADRRESFEMLKAFAAARTKREDSTVHPTVVTAFGERVADNPTVLILHSWKPSEFGAEVILNVEELVCEQCSTRTMRALTELDGVIHIEADFAKDRVWVWTEGESPDTGLLTAAVEESGFKVTHIHTESAKDADEAEGATKRNE